MSLLARLRPLLSKFNAAGLLLLLLAWGAYGFVQRPPATPEAPSLKLAEQRTVPVTLYFSDAQVQGFVRAVRNVQVASDNPAALAQASLRALVAGPQPGDSGARGAVAVVPAGTAVPTVWVRGDHYLVGLPGRYARLNYGPSGERMVLCSMVRTLLERRGHDVTFLVNGQNADTLLGHLDLRSPFAREDCATE